MDTDPLFALLEVMLKSFAPRVKPGGYSEDMFLHLTEEEKEELECSICYNILKETRECSNKHRFCYSCIFVWSTSGNPINHSRCPMCRADGYYVRNKTVDEIINQKHVRCSMENCNWIGPLKEFGSHRHDIYTTTKKARPTQESVTELPSLNKQSRTSRMSAKKQLPNSSYRSIQKVSHPSRQNGGPTRISAVSSTRSMNNSTSPQRHQNLSNRRSSRLLSRGQINQDQVLSESRNHDQVSDYESSVSTPRTPRPPSSPRPANLPNIRRRVTTFPSLIQSDNNNNQSSTNDNGDDDAMHARLIFTTPREESRAPGEVQLVSIRDRLVESRNRLDSLMGAFTFELERGRQEISEFQEERERRRQEQLEEVRDLGRRLGNVASELRRLLNQRRLRNTLHDLVTDDDDEDDF